MDNIRAMGDAARDWLGTLPWRVNTTMFDG
jgi:hypothetical protein